MMTLHDAIVHILKESGGPMKVRDITEAINREGLAARYDGTAVCDFQVHGRSYNRSDLFIRKGELVDLKAKK